MLVLLACTRWWKRFWVTDLSISSYNASIMVLRMIQILLSMMITHSTYVATTVLQHVHWGDLVVTWLILAWPMSTARKTLIVQPQIRNFWKKSLLSTHWKLLVSLHGILLDLRLVFQTCGMVSRVLVLLGPIIPLWGVTFAGAGSDEKTILLLLLPTLGRYRVIVLLVIMSAILLGLDWVRLHIWSGSMRIWAVTVALTPLRVVTELLLL